MTKFLEEKIKSVGIILVVYKQKQHLRLLYESIAEQIFTDIKVYFVDNNPDESERLFSEEINRKLGLDIAYIKAGYNSGFAGGNNIGARRAIADGCEFVFFLNNDVELDKNCIAELVKALKKNRDAGAAAPLILFGKPSGKEGFVQEFGAKAHFNSYKIEKYYEGREYNKIKNEIAEVKEVDLLSGGAAFARAEMLNKTGLWEERYFAYGDEIDLAKRIREAGYTSIAVSSAILWHNHPWQKENKRGFYFEYYLIQRNKYLYFHKYKKYFPMFASVILDTFKFPRRLSWFKKICDFRLGIYYIKGTIAGIFNKKGPPKEFVNG